MNIEKIFNAVKADPQQDSLLITVIELEKQGYKVFINGQYNGSKDLEEAEERNEAVYLPFINGIMLNIKKEHDIQEFKVHFLDNNRICFTQVDSLPVILNPEFTTGLYKSN